MPEAQPDAKMMEWLAFPGPVHRIAGSRSPARLAAGYVAVALLFVIGAALLVGYFGFTSSGRSMFVDTALAAGLGAPLPEARIEMGACDYSGSRAGSKLPGQWRCLATVTHAGEQTTVAVETVHRNEDLRALGAGRVFGATGIYWPWNTIAARWWNAFILVLIGAGLMGLAVMLLRMAGDARRLHSVRHGHVRSADLLTWQSQPWFAFVDDAGTRRFQRAGRAAFPLVLDGVRSTGAALVHGQEAVLLEADLYPMDMDKSLHDALIERAKQIQRQCQVRSELPPQPGDPATLVGRIEAIERALADKPASTELVRLYDACWRLVWDSNDADVANRALVARDMVALRLGPEAAFAALRACRCTHAAA